MRRRHNVKGHYRRNPSSGNMYYVNNHSRQSMLQQLQHFEHKTTRANFSKIKDVVMDDTVSEWVSTRQTKEGLLSRMFSRDKGVRMENGVGRTRTIKTDIGANGEGVVKFVISGWPKDDIVDVKIGPGAEIVNIEPLSASHDDTWTPTNPKHIADLSSINLNYCTAPNLDLGGMNFARSNMEGGTFLGTDFSACDLRQVRFKDAMLKDADLRLSDLSGADMSGADLSGANLLGANLTGVNWKGVNLDGAIIGPDKISSELAAEYDKYDFYETAEALGLSEKQLEFLIVSKVVEVRDNETHALVESDFDPAKHHVPAWVVQNWIPHDEAEPVSD